MVAPTVIFSCIRSCSSVESVLSLPGDTTTSQLHSPPARMRGERHRRRSASFCCCCSKAMVTVTHSRGAALSSCSNPLARGSLVRARTYGSARAGPCVVPFLLGLLIVAELHVLPYTNHDSTGARSITTEIHARTWLNFGRGGAFD